MRNKYKIYSVILTGIILTGCKSVRMTSQDRQQFMPNGISVAQQLLEETEDATSMTQLSVIYDLTEYSAIFAVRREYENQFVFKGKSF